jgi:hypothetical protein
MSGSRGREFKSRQPDKRYHAGLFADDLDRVADQLDRAFTKLDANQMRTAKPSRQSNQGVLPFENPPEQGTG